MPPQPVDVGGQVVEFCYSKDPDGITLFAAGGGVEFHRIEGKGKIERKGKQIGAGDSRIL